MTRRVLLTLATLAAMAAGAPARAELTVESETGPEGEQSTFRMTVTPAAEPVPALRHRLMLRDIGVKDGNAAPKYYRAIMASPRITKALNDKFGEDWYEWAAASGDAFPIEKAREAAALIDDSVVSELREAAARRDCDWDWQLGEIHGPELFAYLLPEIQESRQLSRFLALQARLAVAEQRFDDAIDLVRINAKMGRDVAGEPLLVCGLVGIAECSIGNRVLVDLIAAPNSPNLYWALSELPDPPVSLREAARFEMSNILRILPFLNDAETQEHSGEEWARLLAEALTSLQQFQSHSYGYPNEKVAQMAVTALSMTTYPAAKGRLIAGGMDPLRVQQMPVGQVIAVDANHEFRRIADGLEKWWYVPYRQRDADAERSVGKVQSSAGYGGMLAAMLLPALSAARSAEVRLEWQTDALCVVEAIRMHAAETRRLPTTLDDIAVVPVPDNPLTGNPYDYRLEGDTAVLELPFSDGMPGAAWRFEIKLAK